MDFNTQDVIIECHHCNKELIVKVLEITNHATVTCPHCKAKMDLTANDPSAHLGEQPTYHPFEGLDQYIEEVNKKRKK
ncbi:MAG: hypothetical protein ACEPOZ_21575 [Marinifilaceae bacterium]